MPESTARLHIDRRLERDIIEWDVRNWGRALDFWTPWINRVAPLKALAIGERGGGLSLWLALQGIRVMCTDLNTFPPETGALHQRHGVSRHVAYAQQDATTLPIRDEAFDLVMFKSVIGALTTRERQQRAIAEMYRVLRPGGVLLFAENLVATRLHGWIRQRLVPDALWRHQWRYLHPGHDRDLFAAFQHVEFRTWGLVANLGRSEAQRGLLAYVDTLLCPLVPQGWHYILLGACVKAKC